MLYPVDGGDLGAPMHCTEVTWPKPAIGHRLLNPSWCIIGGTRRAFVDTPAAKIKPETKAKLLKQALKLKRNPDRAIAFPLGASNFRALLIDRFDEVVGTFEVPDPVNYYQDFEHAVAAALVQFDCLPVSGAAFFAGALPARGLLEFTNLHGWPRVDRRATEKLFGFRTAWMQDGTAGYYGLPRLDSNDFQVLRMGSYRPGDSYIYAIFGTGINVGCPLARDDGHLLFVPRGRVDSELQMWLKQHLGHWPEWEDVISGGKGIRNVAEFYLHQHNVGVGDNFKREFDEAPPGRRGEVVTRYALDGHPSAVAAAKMSFEYLGAWLGAMAISHQAQRIDLSPGILSDPAMRQFMLKETGFLASFEDQGRPLYKDFARMCMVRVCLRNPEHEGAVEQAAELLRLAG